MQESSKNLLRIALRKRRQNLPLNQVQDDSTRIRANLLSLERIRLASSVMLYLPAQRSRYVAPAGSFLGARQRSPSCPVAATTPPA